MRRTALLLVALSQTALAQIGGPGTYPQFRSMSGLPGSGYGVTPDGRVDPTGAWSISTPIAYSLRPWQFVVGIGNYSSDLEPRFSDTANGDLGGNGTGQISVGLPLGRYGTGTYTLMILSRRFDNAGNFTWTPPGQKGPVRFGAGVQDISGGGGTQGETIGVDRNSSRSFYVVGTFAGERGFSASMGVGDRRFQGAFGNVSMNLAPRLKAVGEYDRFNWNYGLGFDLGKIGNSPRRGADAGASLFLGVIDGRYAYWSVNFRF